MKKQNKKNNIKKMITFISLIILLLSIFTFAYYTNVNKYFSDSIKNDGNGGLALKRTGNEFITDGCGIGTILDTVTGLCWLKNMNTFGAQTWTNASINCSNLNYAGHTNWVLPTRNELFTLIDQIGTSGTTCTSLTGFGFTNCQPAFYWSQDVYQPNTVGAWIVPFNSGGSYIYAKTNTYYFTCVVRN